MEYIRKFFDTLGSARDSVLGSEVTPLVMLVVLLFTGIFFWACHMFGNDNDDTGYCGYYKEAAIWMNFIAVCLVAFIMGKNAIYPKAKNAFDLI